MRFGTYFDVGSFQGSIIAITQLPMISAKNETRFYCEIRLKIVSAGS